VSNQKAPSCLFVANIFAPIRGGSATVYETLARLGAPGEMAVLTAWRHYGTGQEIQGWDQYDANARYPVTRLELLRPRVMPRPANKLVSAWRYLVTDIPIALRVAVSALRLVRRHGIEVVCIGELASGAWIGEFLRRVVGTRLVFYIHGEEITTRHTHGKFGGGRRRALQGADAIVAVSRFTVNALRTEFDVDPAKIHLIPNGVDTRRFSPALDDGRFRARFDLGDHPIVLCVGRLVARKGFDRTIQAWPQVLAGVPDARLVIVGEGDQAAELQRLADDAGVRDTVKLVGPLSDGDLVAAYRAATIFAMPNRTLPDGDTEGFGLVFLEANACGRAVVGGRAGGAVEAVIDGQTGLLVDGNQPGEIAEALVRLLTDHALRHRMEQAGLEHARCNDWAARARMFRDMCRQLCEAQA
jgi:phosphatidylinositol alpha-1,6-mannosyltransferase